MRSLVARIGVAIVVFGLAVGAVADEDEDDGADGRSADERFASALREASPAGRVKLLRALKLRREVAARVLVQEIGLDKSLHSGQRNAAITMASEYLAPLTPEMSRTCLANLTVTIAPLAIVSDTDQLRMWPFRYALWRSGWSSVPLILEWIKSKDLSENEVRHISALLRSICGRASALALVRGQLSERSPESMRSVLKRLKVR